MAEDDKIINPSPAIDENANLKAFMGESYKDGLTLKDINAFLNGKKFADLNGGGYVAKGKYEALEKKHNDYLESTKDYEAIKTKNAEYVAKEKEAILHKQAKDAGIDEKFIKYALSEIDPKAEDTSKALKDWIKANPQFKVYDANSQKVFEPINHETGNQPKTSNELINALIRKQAGR